MYALFINRNLYATGITQEDLLALLKILQENHVNYFYKSLPLWY